MGEMGKMGEMGEMGKKNRSLVSHFSLALFQRIKSLKS